MKLDHIALQGCRYNHGALLAHVCVSARLRKSGCLAQMEPADIFGIADQIIHTDAGGYLREYRSDQV